MVGIQGQAEMSLKHVIIIAAVLLKVSALIFEVWHHDRDKHFSALSAPRGPCGHPVAHVRYYRVTHFHRGWWRKGSVFSVPGCGRARGAAVTTLLSFPFFISWQSLRWQLIFSSTPGIKDTITGDNAVSLCTARRRHLMNSTLRSWRYGPLLGSPSSPLWLFCWRLQSPRTGVAWWHLVWAGVMPRTSYPGTPPLTLSTHRCKLQVQQTCYPVGKVLTHGRQELMEKRIRLPCPDGQRWEGSHSFQHLW